MKIRHMNMRQILAALAAAFVLAGGMPAYADASMPAGETGGPSQTADEAPAFLAYIDYSPQGYVVYGESAEFFSDTCRVQTLYSLDGTNYQVYHREWNIPGSIESSVTSGSAIRTTQICLQANDEPLRDYLAKTLDRFYLKLRITRENGMTHETNAAVIERSCEPQPIPDGLTPAALFPSSMRVRSSSGVYGRYQLTVRDTATAEEIASYLPDTLPIEVQIGNGVCVVDCPVTWKPLVLSGLTAGESVTIADAAEAVAVPGGTLLDTPLGVYRLEEPLSLDQGPRVTDEIRLVLNTVSADEAPTGVLAVDRGALKISFDRKPTGATAIRAYTLAEGETAWTEIQGLALLEAVNSQPSTANSGYATVLDSDAEPFCSYLAAEAAGIATPFFVGLKIEGGVYDGRQLVLAWPDVYELPPSLPAVDNGSGGNEGNAGSDNQNDSTEGGQRPNLPQTPEVDTDQPEDEAYPPASDRDESGTDPSKDSTGQPEDGTDPSKDSTNQPEDGADPSKDSTDQPDNGTDQPEDDAYPPAGDRDESGQISDGSGENYSGALQEKRPDGTAGGETAGDSMNPTDNGETGQQRLPEVSLHPAAAGLASANMTIRMKQPGESGAALLTAAGIVGVAGVCAAVSGKTAAIRLLGRIIGKIRASWRGVFK